MSSSTQAYLVGGVLVLVAGVVAWLAWRAGRSPVVWMRPVDGRMAHAVRKADLRAGRAELGSVGSCGRWPVAELERDDAAERCPACLAAVAELGRGGL